MSRPLEQLRSHVAQVSACAVCPEMKGPAVTGSAVMSQVMLIGQAPGAHEIDLRRPFAWTAGKTLFRWFGGLGVTEEAFRSRVYMAAVCRCFPGKNPAGGDRVPSPDEVTACSRWLAAEVRLLRPRLVIPVGKLAIGQVMRVGQLAEVVGRQHHVALLGVDVDVIPLPHPSGASVWHRIEPGASLLADALAQIGRHPAFRALVRA